MAQNAMGRWKIKITSVFKGFVLSSPLLADHEMAAGQTGVPGANVTVKLAELEKDTDEENVIILRK